MKREPDFEFADDLFDDEADIDLAELDALRASPEYAEEELLADAQGFLMRLMEERDCTRADLAAAMGVSRARVSQMLSQRAQNFTLRLLARAVHALGDQVCLRLRSDAVHPHTLDLRSVEGARVWLDEASINDAIFMDAYTVDVPGEVSVPISPPQEDDRFSRAVVNFESARRAVAA